MSTQRNPKPLDSELSEEAVHEYLKSRPGFFERHSGLLTMMRLPHVAGGAVSLIERQVSVLRQKNLKLERKLKELIDVARSNEALAGKIHLFSLQLINTSDFESTLSTIEQSLRTVFNADQSILVLFGDPDRFNDIDKGRFLKVVARDNEALQTFKTFLAGKGSRCGQLRDAQRNFLFGEDTNEIGSAALVPLGTRADIGFLAIGSAEADRFHPGMSTDFLTRLADLTAQALKRF